MNEKTEKRIKQNLHESIEMGDLEYLDIRGSKFSLIACGEFFIKNGKLIGITYDDLLFILGLSNGSYTKEQIELAQGFEVLTDEQKEQETPENIKLYNEIITKLSEREQRLEWFPFKLYGFLVSCQKNGHNKEIDELYNIIQIATGIDIELINNTDYMVLVEIFMRIFIKPQKALQGAFFLPLIVKILRAFIPSLRNTRIDL